MDGIDTSSSILEQPVAAKGRNTLAIIVIGYVLVTQLLPCNISTEWRAAARPLMSHV